MDKQLVAAAVTALQAQGEQPSVRKIHARIGGSFRDILGHLQALGGVLPTTATEEGERTMEHGLMDTTPAVGLIAQAQGTQAHAEQRYHEAMHALTQTRNRLRGLEQDPDELTGPEFAERQAQRHTLSRRLQREQTEMAEAQRDVRDATQALQRLQGRQKELPYLIEVLTFEVGPHGRLGELLRKLEGQVAGVRTEIERRQREIEILQAELATL